VFHLNSLALLVLSDSTVDKTTAVGGITIPISTFTLALWAEIIWKVEIYTQLLISKFLNFSELIVQIFMTTLCSGDCLLWTLPKATFKNPSTLFPSHSTYFRILNTKLFRIDIVADRNASVSCLPLSCHSHLSALSILSLLQLPTAHIIFDNQLPSRKIYSLIESSSCKPSLFVPRT